MNTTALHGAVAEIVARIAGRFHPQRILIFGSRARGDVQADSDVDLLVVMPVQGSTREQANAIDLALADRTVPLDLVVFTPEEYERQCRVYGTIAWDAAHNGRLVYDGAA